MLSRLQKARPEQIGESFNIGKLRGGTSISVIAQRAVADIEFRSVHQVRLHRAAQFIRQEIGRLDPRLAVISTVLGERPAGSTSAKHPLVQDAVATRLEADLPRPELVTSSTDANAAMARSVPAISVSLADSDAVHTPEESVDLSRLPQGLLALNLLVSARLRYRATA
jgi:acetylornithine deacetylase/succinyl-diaminopimelate desuccinylase-like protein